MTGYAGHWRWRDLFGLLLLGAALLFLWQVPWLGWLAYPFRLFGTFVHELGHGLAALATGGVFQRFVVNPDLSGMAWSAGGTRWIVASAGYVGSAVFGSILLLAGRLVPARALLGALGLLLALLCLVYVRNAFGAVTGLALAAGLMLSALYLRGMWAEGLLLVFALQTLLDGFGSVIAVFHLSSQDAVHTDAHTLSELSGLPAPLWAVIWGLFSAVISVLALRLALGRDVPGSAASTTRSGLS